MRWLGATWVLVGSVGLGSFACSKADTDSGSGAPSSSGGSDGGVTGGQTSTGGAPSGGSTSGGAAAGGVASGGSPPADAVLVTLRFRAQVGEEELECGKSYADSGVDGSVVTPAFLRLYVSNIRLLKEDGEDSPVFIQESSPWQGGGVALLDFEDGTGSCDQGDAQLRREVVGQVAPGDYTGVAFSTSVPENLNMADPVLAPAPLQVGQMYWGWALGYRFFAAEFVSAPASGEGGASGARVGFHLGSLGCTRPAGPGAGGSGQEGEPCEASNYNDIRLLNFRAEEDAVVIDLASLLSEVDLGTSTQCHGSEDICEPFFGPVGLDFATGEALSTQTVFRVGRP
jgi:uncharacterized repeat protein (TIGR04052 family)